MSTIRFLEIIEIISIHEDQVKLFGGLQGIRDYGLLDSATNNPRASFAGNYLHKDIFEMAAVYVFSIIKNHPFLDGNKRTGILSALIFLEYNGVTIHLTNKQLFEVSIAIATSTMTCAEIAEFFREKSKKPKK